jgi:hypothetical protein
MFKRTLLFLLGITAFFVAGAQVRGPGGTDTFGATGSHLRISLLTCGPGDEEVYEVFGHTAVRVIDSAVQTDIVFNYGMFEYGPDFEMKFMRGKLRYCVGIETYGDFVQEYVVAKRKVEEQVLLLDAKQKESIYAFLDWNAEPANKYYRYDFFYDNCATRIRDIFNRPEVFGTDFVFANALPQSKQLTFRDIINQYFYLDHWTRLGVNILLGSKIDVKMSNADIMFLPDYLRDGVAGATVKGMKMSTKPEVILSGEPAKQAGVNWALVLTCMVAVLTIVGLTVPSLRVLGKVMGATVLLVSGLLGMLILVMWFATNHQGCSNNFNILWALPTNLIIAFANPKGKPRYAMIGMILIGIELVLHFAKVQGIIIELVPVLISLLFIYWSIYRKSLKKTHNA